MSIKICSVAISSYIFFKEQFDFSLKNSAGLALSAAVLTLVLEKIRPKSKETNDWFECKRIDLVNDLASIREKLATLKEPLTKIQEELATLDELIEKKKLQVQFLSNVVNIQIILNIVGLFYSARFGFLQIDLISFVSENKLKRIPMATVIAPIVEEILFRGFFTEWLEVGCDLVARHIYAISKESQHHISNFAQAIVFGAGHMISKNKTENALIFAVTGILGVTQGQWKRVEEGSLLFPIQQHIKVNTMSLFMAIYLIPFLKEAVLSLKKA